MPERPPVVALNVPVCAGDEIIIHVHICINMRLPLVVLDARDFSKFTADINTQMQEYNMTLVPSAISEDKGNKFYFLLVPRL